MMDMDRPPVEVRFEQDPKAPGIVIIGNDINPLPPLGSLPIEFRRDPSGLAIIGNEFHDYTAASLTWWERVKNRLGIWWQMYLWPKQSR